MEPMSVARRLGRYRIGERIGTGGVADVFRAEAEGAAGFAKTLVVKCLRPHMQDEQQLAGALAREAKLAQRLHHGNIVQVFDFGIDDGTPYVVMEHVDGCSLHELLCDLARHSEPMTLEEALFVLEELAAALRYVHGLTDEDGTPLHLVHRDVKPRNVLVSREGVVKLADFGIAKVAGDDQSTLPGVIKGTPAYLSPEQAMARPVDGRTDIFALGLVLRDVLGDGLTLEFPVDPRADDALWAIYERATADEPTQRFEDVSAMLRALRRWRSDHEIEAHPGKLAAWVRRARGQAPVAAPRSLDAALLGGPEHASHDSTRPGGLEPHTTRPGPIAPDEDPPPLRRGFLALAGAFALGGVAWAVMDDDESAPPQTPVTPMAGPTTPGSIETSRPEPETPLVPSSGAPSEPTSETSASDSTDASTTTGGSAPAEAARPRAKPGRLVVNVLPWAEVTVDGRPQGRVPVDIPLAPGRHRVRLHNPQMGGTNKVIQIRTGQTTTLNKW